MMVIASERNRGKKRKEIQRQKVIHYRRFGLQLILPGECLSLEYTEGKEKPICSRA